MFINDNYPKAANGNGKLETEKDWSKRFVRTNIGNNVSIGSNATILGNVNIKDNAMIGAGSVVTEMFLKNRYGQETRLKILSL